MDHQTLKPVNPSRDYYARLQSILGNSPEKIEKKGEFHVPPVYSNDHSYEILNSGVKMSDVIQPKSLKDQLHQFIEEYNERALLKDFYGIQHDNTLLFSGPSGCGKTLTALALAATLKKKLFLVNLSTIVSSSLGKTSTNIFELVEDAKTQNAVIFFDEFDALAKVRTDENDHGEIKRVASALLQVLDFLDDRVLVIAATNHLDLVDKAILRRFKKKLSFDLPSKATTQTYLKVLLKKAQMSCSQDLMNQLTSKYLGLSYAEIRDSFLSDLKTFILKKHKKSSERVRSITKDFLPN